MRSLFHIAASNVNAMRVTTSLLLLFLVISEPILGQDHEAYLFQEQTFSIEESGSISYSGVEITLTPDPGPSAIAGFWVKAHYDDPIVKNDKGVNFLEKTFFPLSCDTGYDPRTPDPFTWYNGRGIGFAVTFEQHCKQVEPGNIVPYLEFRIWCTDPASEARYLKAIHENRVFDITPSGQFATAENNVYETLKYLQTTYKLVSTVMTVLDVVAFSHGGIKATKFVVKLIVGQSVDALVDEGFEYAKAKYGYEVRFHHVGWNIRCLLCGQSFFRKTLLDGELLKCPNSTCDGEAYIHFE